MRRIHISSSIANFHDRLRDKYADYEDYRWFSTDSTIFFGFYHIGDYLRLLCHFGPTTIFWCGSDIKTFPTLIRELFGESVQHFCENSVEWSQLREYGVYAHIQPMLLDDPEKYESTYVQSERPMIWMTVHPGRENEYGLARLLTISDKVNADFYVYGCPYPLSAIYNEKYPNVHFKMRIGTDAFNRQTSRMQATIRFNEFDGFSENLAKAVLRGQYAFSVIPYPGIETIVDNESLIASLNELKNKQESNPVSDEWRATLSKRIEV